MRFLSLVIFLLLTLPAAALQSNPGATHTLLLDFGHYNVSANWPLAPSNSSYTGGGTYTSPALFPSTPSDGLDAQQQNDYIYRIWRRVAEDFAPFDVNVVVIYGNETANEMAAYQAMMSTGFAARAAVGGEPSDIGGSSAAPPAGYLDPALAHEVLVRGREPGGALRPVSNIARTISHEAGHLYGANYHYLTPQNDEGSNCQQSDSSDLREALLSAYLGVARDGWWSGLGFGSDAEGNSSCRMRADVDILRTTLGRRAPLLPLFDINPLVPQSSSTLVGHGVIAYDNATYAQDQWVEFLQQPCPSRNCALIPMKMLRIIGKGPNEWLFVGTSNLGGIRITVNTTNRDTVPGTNNYIDVTSANLNADFSVWMADSPAMQSWTQVLSSADRVSGDKYSATKTYRPDSGTGTRIYSVSVGTREDGYGQLGQYSIEVYGTNGTLEAYSPESFDGDVPPPPPPVTTIVTPKAPAKTTNKATIKPRASAPTLRFSFGK